MKGIVAEVTALDGNRRLVNFGDGSLNRVFKLVLLSGDKVICGIQIHENIVDFLFLFFTHNLSVVEIENFISRECNLGVILRKFRKSNHRFVKNGVLLLTIKRNIKSIMRKTLKSLKKGINGSNRKKNARIVTRTLFAGI